MYFLDIFIFVEYFMYYVLCKVVKSLGSGKRNAITGVFDYTHSTFYFISKTADCRL